MRLLRKRVPKRVPRSAQDICGAEAKPRDAGKSNWAKKFVILCTNALLLAKKIDQYKPSPFFAWSIHLDGDREMHDRSVCQTGVYDKAIEAIRRAKARGFRVQINCTLFNNAEADKAAAFFDSMKDLGLDGITVSPGYAYERAPDQQHFLNRTKTKELFRDILRAIERMRLATEPPG